MRHLQIIAELRQHIERGRRREAARSGYPHGVRVDANGDVEAALPEDGRRLGLIVAAPEQRETVTIVGPWTNEGPSR